ncbi:hypothetical protein A2U01_0077748, partial [Trifolium medium]|nr:hypothetical protein [Trifolium medium]
MAGILEIGKDPEIDPRPSKRSKIKKDVGKIRKDMIKLFEGLNNQNDLLLYLMFKSQIIRDWIITHLCPALKIVPPPVNP